MTTNSDSEKLREFLHAKIAKRKQQIHPAHNPRFNHYLQLETDCIEWAIKKIEVNKIPNDRLEGVIQSLDIPCRCHLFIILFGIVNNILGLYSTWARICICTFFHLHLVVF